MRLCGYNKSSTPLILELTGEVDALPQTMEKHLPKYPVNVNFHGSRHGISRKKLF